MVRQIHQILPTLLSGDAIGNHALELRRLLREWGYQSEIFAEHWQPSMAGECHHYEEYRGYSQPGNLLIFHYAIGSAVNRFVLDLPDHVVLYYHNITPAHFFYGVNGEMARLLDDARRNLVHFVGKVPAIAASPYNRQELEAFGIQVVGVVPYIPTLEKLDIGLEGLGATKIRQRFAKHNTVDWLFVGRLAPNKCIHDVIKTFYYYHAWIEPRSRLLLVGSREGQQSYVADLDRLVTQLELDGAVVFAGSHAAADGLAAFYQMADVYLSMSEHEGFCVPLIEAMYYGVPVLAYASTGVPFTLDDAGVLFRHKDHPVVAEMAHEVVVNGALRARLLEKQRARVAAFAPDRVRALFRQCIDSLGVR